MWFSRMWFSRMWFPDCDFPASGLGCGWSSMLWLILARCGSSGSELWMSKISDPSVQKFQPAFLSKRGLRGAEKKFHWLDQGLNFTWDRLRWLKSTIVKFLVFWHEICADGIESGHSRCNGSTPWIKAVDFRWTRISGLCWVRQARVGTGDSSHFKTDFIPEAEGRLEAP